MKFHLKAKYHIHFNLHVVKRSDKDATIPTRSRLIPSFGVEGRNLGTRLLKYYVNSLFVACNRIQDNKSNQSTDMMIALK